MKKNFWSDFSAWVNGDRDDEISAAKPGTGEKLKKPQIRRMSEKQRLKLFSVTYCIVAVLACVTIVAVLIYTIFRLPLFGDPQNPAVNEVVKRYVENGLEETGAVNMVSGMILDYRAFDTFGESSVLFLAITCVMMLLLRDKNNISREEDIREEHERAMERASNDMVLKRVTSVVMPWIILFGVYVVLNGHISPGGGFSGGAIMGSGLILCSIAYDADAVSRIFTMKTFRAVTSTALLCYAASKAYAFFTGANGLPTGIPLGTPGAIFSSGLILVLDICVGLIVACTMYGFYTLFSKGDF